MSERSKLRVVGLWRAKLGVIKRVIGKSTCGQILKNVGLKIVVVMWDCHLIFINYYVNTLQKFETYLQFLGFEENQT